MSNTIINKKGNTGYYVRPWNFLFTQRQVKGETVPSIYTGKEVDVFQFAVEQVTVHSCGKKVMRLQSMQRGKMETHQTEYNPGAPIYTTREAAVAAAHAEFNANPEAVGRTCTVIDYPYAEAK